MTSAELRKNDARSLETDVCNSELRKEKNCSRELAVNTRQGSIIAS